ncbi:MAG: hypothetical protein IKT58_05120 [Oscillospiraceae bacterium]|nr:hypothetical protein [Oscillospiraceae bacterium]
MLLPLMPFEAQGADPADMGSYVTNLPTGQNLFITLYNGSGASDYRWNVSGLGELNSDLHLYNATGTNCNFKLTHVEGGYYGIKFVKENGIDRYVDVPDRSTADGKVLHIWESSDDKFSGNNHRQFAFYKAGTDSAGNQLYYIKIRHSGKFVGLQNNSVTNESKLIQTSTNPRKWYITPCTVPLTGKESQPWTGSNSVYCELFARNTNLSVSVQGREGNIETDGMGLNLYHLGQSSRWLLRYNSSYKAYEIASTKYETEKGLSTTGKVWDTGSEKADTDLNVWSSQSKTNNENTSQFWRFVKNSDGTYLIYNAKSGKYVAISGEKLTQGSKSQAQAFELSLLSTVSTSDYGNVFGGTREELNWMKSIPDTVLLSEINFPATHDTGTMAVIQDMNSVLDNMSVTKCQKHYFEEQLATGVRSFDVRTNASASNKTVHDVMIVHGGEHFQCYNRYGGKLSLGELLDISKLFLSKHPSESIIMLVKPDAGTHEDVARTLGAYIDANPELFWQSNTVPTLRQARGKIVLLRRFETNSSNQKTAFGPDLTKWDDQDYAASKSLVKLPQSSGAQVYVQDAYQQTGGAKKEYVQGAMNASASVPKNAYIYNYTSCTLGFVIDTSRDVNEWLSGLDLKGKRLGNVMLNYSDLILNRKIFRSNSFSQPALDQGVSIYHNLDLASDISVNYVIPQSQLAYYDSFYLSVTMDRYEGNSLSVQETVTLQGRLNGTYYYFTLTGRNAVQVGDGLKAKLYMEKDGIRYCSAEDSYSIRNYCMNQLTKTGSSEALRKLCAELLRYGSCAQIYKSYRTDALCDRDMSEEDRALLTDPESILFGQSAGDLQDLPDAPVRWAGKGLNLDSKVQLIFAYLPGEYEERTEELQLRVQYKDIYGNQKEAVVENSVLYHAGLGYYAFYFHDLLAAELRQPVRGQIYAGDVAVSSIMEYSADSYGKGKSGALLDVCRAMCAYSDGAKAYFLSVA